MGDILPDRDNPKHTNWHGELGVNNGSKTHIDRGPHSRSHKVNLRVAKEVTDKYNLVEMTPLQSEGSWTRNIRINQIKRMLRL
jgi:hypothetical protein